MAATALLASPPRRWFMIELKREEAILSVLVWWESRNRNQRGLLVSWSLPTGEGRLYSKLQRRDVPSRGTGCRTAYAGNSEFLPQRAEEKNRQTDRQTDLPMKSYIKLTDSLSTGEVRMRKKEKKDGCPKEEDVVLADGEGETAERLPSHGQICRGSRRAAQDTPTS